MNVAEVAEMFDLGEGVGGAVAEDEVGGFGFVSGFGYRNAERGYAA